MDRISASEMEDYIAKRNWLHEQQIAGRLKRGWKTKVTQAVPYTYTMVVNVLSGREFSPPVLEMVYNAVKRALGEELEENALAKFDNTTRLIYDLQSQRASIADQLEALELAHKERMRVRELAHQTATKQLVDKLTTLDEKLVELRGRLEYQQMEVEDQYGWTPDEPIPGLEDREEDAVAAE